MENKNYAKGILFVIMSAFSFSLMAVFVRLSGDVPVIQKSLFRNLVSFLVALVTILVQVKRNGRSVIDVPKGAWPFLLIRSAVGTMGVFCYFYAIDHLILADSSILQQMAPFFTILFSFLILGEKIAKVPMFAMIGAFMASVLVVKPGFDFHEVLPALTGIAGGMCSGLAYTCVRKLGKMKVNSKLVVLVFSIFSIVVALPFVLLDYYPMSLAQLGCLLAAGLCAAGGQFAITAAYYNAPAGKISIFEYSDIIWAALFGFVFFGQIPDVLSILGYVLIVSMAVLNFFYNQKKGE